MNQPTSKDRIAPVLPVSDVVAASHYFRDKLGFTIERACGSDNGRPSAVVARGTSTIILVPKEWPPGCAIQVDNVDVVEAELVARQAVFESGATNQDYDERDFLVEGPDGYYLRFWEPLEPGEGFGSPPDTTGNIDIPF
jgi:hypothetical protein